MATTGLNGMNWTTQAFATRDAAARKIRSHQQLEKLDVFSKLTAGPEQPRYLDFPQNLTIRLGKTYSWRLLPKTPAHGDQPARIAGPYCFYTIAQINCHRLECSGAHAVSQELYPKIIAHRP